MRSPGAFPSFYDSSLGRVGRGLIIIVERPAIFDRVSVLYLLLDLATIMHVIVFFVSSLAS